MADDFDVGPIVTPDSSQPSTPTAQPTPSLTPTPQSDSSATPSGDQGRQQQDATDWRGMMMSEIQKAEQRQQDLEAKMAPYYENLQKSLQEYQQTLQQQPPQAPQLQQPTYNQQSVQDMNKQRFQYLAIALPLAVILGARGRGASWAAMGAFGQGLTSLIQGQNEKADKQYHNWQEANKEMIQDYDLKMQQYRTVLENRKLSLEAQTQMINAIAAANGDSNLARIKTMAEIQKNLEQKETAGEKAKRESDKIDKQTLAHMSESPEGQAYTSKIEAMGGEDPYSSYENKKKAEKLLPFSEFHKQYTQEQTQDKTKKTDTPTQKEYDTYIANAYMRKTGHKPSNDEEWMEAYQLKSYDDWYKEFKGAGKQDITTGQTRGFSGQQGGTSQQDFQDSFKGLGDFFKTEGD